MTRQLSKETMEILRQRVYGFGAENDTSNDDVLKELPAREIVEHLCGWEIGDDAWVTSFIGWCAEATGRTCEQVEQLLFSKT